MLNRHFDSVKKEQIVEQVDYSQHIANVLIEKHKYIYLHTRSGNNILLNGKVFLPHPSVFEFIELVNKYLANNLDYRSVVDVGTGSGIIICEIAKKYPDKKLMCTDVSTESERISKENITNNSHGIVFHKSRRGMWIPSSCKQVDLVVSNPPYTAQNEIQKSDFIDKYPDYIFQPKTALHTYDRYGLSPYAHILHEGLSIGAKTFIFECNSLTIDMVKNMIIKEFDLTVTQSHKDPFLSFLVVEKS